MADYGYYVGDGHVTETALTQTSAGINVEYIGFNLGAVGWWQWGPPDRELTTRPEREYVQMLDESQQEHGTFHWQWGWPYMPYEAAARMAYYLGLASAVNWTTLYGSALCTVRTLVWGYFMGASSTDMQQGQYRTFQCRVLKPRPNIDYKAAYLGFENLIWRFVGGTDVTGT